MYESGIEEGGAGILVQVDGYPVPSTYYIYTTKRGYAYLCYYCHWPDILIYSVYNYAT